MRLFTSKKWFLPLCLVVGLAVFGVTYHMSKVDKLTAPAPTPEDWDGHNHPPPGIFDAVYQDNITLLERLLRQGADPNQVLEDGTTPLRIALNISDSLNNSFGMVQALLRHGANPNQPDNDGYTPMNIAGGNNDEAVMTEMLQAGGDPNYSHPNFITPYEAALGGGNTKTLAAIERHTMFRPEGYEQQRAMGFVMKAIQESIEQDMTDKEKRAHIARTVNLVKGNLDLDNPEHFIDALVEQTNEALNESDLEQLRQAPRQR